MTRLLLIALLSTISSCALQPNFQYFQGGDEIKQSGVSFTLPEGHTWAALFRSSFQSAFGATDMPQDSTIIVSTSLYSIPPVSDKKAFLQMVSEVRASEPDTGRYEVLSNVETLYSERNETCVIYESMSNDFGENAKRGGSFSLFQTIGMHCIHPVKTNVGVQLEFSRKAPANSTSAEFKSIGQKLLKSAVFTNF